jgi:hypothetical protein
VRWKGETPPGGVSVLQKRIPDAGVTFAIVFSLISVMVEEMSFDGDEGLRDAGRVGVWCKSAKTAFVGPIDLNDGVDAMTGSGKKMESPLGLWVVMTFWGVGRPVILID